MSRVQNYSFSGYPSSYDTEISSANGDFNVNNGCTDTNSTTYARFQGSSQENRTWYYKFNTSTISQFANITSVSWKAKVNVPKNKDTWTLSLSNLTTSTGSVQTPTKTTTYIITDETDGGNWIAANLNNLRFKIVPTSNTNINYFYGADLYINYSITWYAISTASSVAGVSITSSVAEVESGNSVTLTTNASSLTGITIKDNGVDVTSNFTGTSRNYKYTLTNINADHSFTVTEKSSQGSGVSTKENGVWNEASAVWKKISGNWVQQTDTQNIFTDQVYIKTDGTLFIRKN